MYKQLLIIAMLFGVSCISQAHNQTSTASENIILKGLAAPGDANQLSLINEFSEGLRLVCRQQRLPSCAFPQLFSIYKQDLTNIKSSEKSGIEIANIPGFEKSFAPRAPQAGAWISVPFSLADGTQTVTRMIITKIALEKSLLAHKAYINALHPQYLNEAATFALPQIIASFSGYSLSLKALKYAESFSCNISQNSKGSDYCKEKEALAFSIQTEINNSLDEASVGRLYQLDNSNSIDKNLKTKMVVEATQAIRQIKNELSSDQILAAIQGQASFKQIQNLESIIAEMSVSPVAINELDYHRMLTAVAILSEMASIKASSRTFPSTFQYEETPLKQKISDEMSLSKNWIAIYMNQQEELPQ